MNQNRLGCLSVALFLALALSLFINLLFVLNKSARTTGVLARAPERFNEAINVPAIEGEAGAESKIVVISLRGIITSSEPGSVGETMVDDLKLQLRQAATDEKVKAVVLYVDSPGGEVTASDTIYMAVKRFRDSGDKPIVVYMGSLAASGGYYVACGGDYIMANETTLTGSIGVIMQTLNYRELMGKVGLEQVVFKSGKFKDLLSGARELTEEERVYVQGMVMQTYDKFVGIVARERKQDEQGLRTGVADGRVLSGKDAMANKLVDGLGEVEDAYAKAMQLAGAKGAAVVRYETRFTLGRIFEMLGSSEEAKAKVEVNLTGSLMPKLEAGRLYFLPGYFLP